MGAARRVGGSEGGARIAFGQNEICSGSTRAHPRRSAKQPEGFVPLLSPEDMAVRCYLCRTARLGFRTASTVRPALLWLSDIAARADDMMGTCHYMTPQTSLETLLETAVSQAHDRACLFLYCVCSGATILDRTRD